MNIYSLMMQDDTIVKISVITVCLLK